MSFATRNAIRAKFDAQTQEVINIDMQNLEWNKERKILSMGMWTGSFPDKIFVKSNHTGKIVCFMQDRLAAFDNEFWDGELMEYMNMSNDMNASKIRLVLSRG
ncbi:MAG TPA: hypothetical protein VFM18_04380 [Methanosarcina sp.]|nr:hypothetical protein [Methanosarcina sp.]